MKFKNFKYTKKKDGETKDYLILTLNERENDFSGIELNQLEDKEIEQLIDIQKDYDIKMKPFVEKAFRKYLKGNVIDDNDLTDPKQLSDSQ